MQAISWAIFGPAAQWSRGAQNISKDVMAHHVLAVVVAGLSPVVTVTWASASHQTQTLSRAHGCSDYQPYSRYFQFFLTVSQMDTGLLPFAKTFFRIGG